MNRKHLTDRVKNTGGGTLTTTHYLLRLDDACPTMRGASWERVLALSRRHGVRPLIGVIPHNEDPLQRVEAPDPRFFDKARAWQSEGFPIALHGYCHVYSSTSGGINPLWNRSEFAGHTLDLQRQKIRQGYRILTGEGLRPDIFFAPSHTYDRLTLQALLEETPIRTISDTIALRPYREGEFAFLPLVGGRCRSLFLPGIFTFCLHPTTMAEDDFLALEDFLRRHATQFLRFQDLRLDSLPTKGIASRLLSWAYFRRRALHQQLHRQPQ